ncbi:AAA family ATPase [Gemmatimonadota bacterium]
MVIGLTSRNAAGKDEVANYLVERRGFSYFSLSDILRDELARRDLPISRENLIETGNSLRKKRGPGVLAELALETLKNEEKAVVVSIRNPGEVEVLRRKQDFILVGVDAPLELRFERARARGRPEDPSSLEKFVAQERAELAGSAHQQQLDACFAMSDRVLVNDGSLEDLYRKVEELL